MNVLQIFPLNLWLLHVLDSIFQVFNYNKDQFMIIFLLQFLLFALKKKILANPKSQRFSPTFSFRSGSFSSYI